MEKSVNIFFEKAFLFPIGFPDDFDCCLDLAKEYHKTNIRKAISLLERLKDKGLPQHLGITRLLHDSFGLHDRLGR